MGTLMRDAQAQKRALVARMRATDAALAHAARQLRRPVDAAIAQLAQDMTDARAAGVEVTMAWLVTTGRLLRLQSVYMRVADQYAAYARAIVTAQVTAAQAAAQRNSRALVNAAVPAEVRAWMIPS